MERTLPLILQWDENFDVGADTGTPVDDKDYQVPFKFTGNARQAHADDRPAEAYARGREAADGSAAQQQDERVKRCMSGSVGLALVAPAGDRHLPGAVIGWQ